MATTSHLGLTLVEQAQAQKEVTVNAAFTRIDAILNTAAKDKDLATPPGSPAAGDVYIVAASPTGDWAGQAKSIAYFDQIWRFITPREGMRLWVADEDVVYSYDGANWLAGGMWVKYATSAGAPTTTQLPNAKDVAIHRDSTAGTIRLAFNDSGTIRSVTLT